MDGLKKESLFSYVVVDLKMYIDNKYCFGSIQKKQKKINQLNT